MRKKCIRCGEKFSYNNEDTYWNEVGSESTKLIDCPTCHCTQAIKYIDMKNPNNDERFYFFKRNNRK